MSDTNRVDDSSEEFHPVDDDVDLITRYLARELPYAEARAVEERLGEDRDFYIKVGPIIKVWTMPVRFGDSLARSQREHGQQEARPRAPIHAPHAAPEPPPSKPQLKVERREARSAAPSRVAGVGSSVVNRRAEPAKRSRPVRRFLVRLAAGMTGLVLLGATMAYRNYSALETVASADLLANEGSPPSSTGGSWETARGETRTITAADGSRVLLRPRSRLTWHAREEWISLSGGATLVGEATIEVSSNARAVLLSTSAGEVLLLPGLYAVRSERGGFELDVSVSRGRALLVGASLLELLPLGQGEYGRVLEHMTLQHSMTGYHFPQPSLTP